jgi:hypothetical protein
VKYCCLNNQRIGSCYFEFQKGKFSDKYWLDSSICLSADIFDSLNLYQVFVKIVSEFDYYGITEINREEWKQIKLTADIIGGIAKDVITEIDSWANGFLSTGNVITFLGI